MFNLFKPRFRKTVLSSSPKIIQWQPRPETDVIIEIQDPDFAFSDVAINTLDKLSEELTLHRYAEPVRPQIELGGRAFDAMQTTMVFGGICKETKLIFLEKVKELMLDEKFTVERENIDKQAS